VRIALGDAFDLGRVPRIDWRTEASTADPARFLFEFVEDPYIKSSFIRFMALPVAARTPPR
jgi:hypothetical protein